LFTFGRAYAGCIVWRLQSALRDADRRLGAWGGQRRRSALRDRWEPCTARSWPRLSATEHIAEWVRLTEELSAHPAPNPRGGRPEGGVRAAARELGPDRDDARRAGRPSPDVKEAARNRTRRHEARCADACAERAVRPS